MEYRVAHTVSNVVGLAPWTAIFGVFPLEICFSKEAFELLVFITFIASQRISPPKYPKYDTLGSYFIFTSPYERFRFPVFFSRVLVAEWIDFMFYPEQIIMSTKQSLTFSEVF